MTPAPFPPPIPRQQERTLLCALRGPLLLITLGILLAVDHMGGQSFSRTWPVLLIVYGLMRLAEFMGSRGN
jgi:hypothetical protein